MPESRFSAWFLGFLAMLFLGYLAVAVLVDPRGYFGVRLLPNVVMDSRRQKMHLFEEFTDRRPVEGLLLGSSRAMKIAPRELEVLTGRPFFNFCVDSARAEDYLAIYKWARSRSTRLKTLLVGLDVEALHSSDEYDDRLTSNGTLMREIEGEPGITAALDELRRRLLSVLSVAYVEDAAWSVWTAFCGREPSTLFDRDGLLHYVEWDRQLAAGTFNRGDLLRRSLDSYRLRFAGMTTLSSKRRGCLEALLRMAKADGLSIVVWITPVHPVLAEYIGRVTQYSRLLCETRTYTRGLQLAYDMEVLDLSQLRSFEGNGSDWYDGAHVTPANASRLTKKLAAALRNRGL